MAEITYRANLPRPANESGMMLPRANSPVAGEAGLTIGMALELRDDGALYKADDASTFFVGFLVSLPHGQTVSAVGDALGVFNSGPMVFPGAEATPGTLAYLGADGTIDDAGTVPVGWWWTPETLIVTPAPTAAETG